MDAHDQQTDIDLQILDLLREESPKSAYRLAGELTRSGEEAVGTHAVRKRLEALASRGLVAGSASALTLLLRWIKRRHLRLQTRGG